MNARGFTVKLLILLAMSLIGSLSLWAGQWAAMGPDGGDVRSLAADPHNPDRIFLGTSTGALFVSNNGGQDWTRFAHLGSGDDYVLDHIAVNPSNTNIMYVSAWTPQSQQAGDLFRSTDGDKTWQTLPGIRKSWWRARWTECFARKTGVTAGSACLRRTTRTSRTLNPLPSIQRIPTLCMRGPGTWPGRRPTAEPTGSTSTRA